MNYTRAVATQSACLAAASGGLPGVWPAIGIRPTEACFGGFQIPYVRSKLTETGIGLYPQHRFGTFPPGHSRFHAPSRPPELHSIPITEQHVAV